MTYRVLLGEPLFAAGASAGPILGLDTGSAVASLGVVAASRVRASISRPVRSHGSDLPSALEEVLRMAGLTLRDLTAIAVALGPGSFTGLRIGLSYAKGLAMALGLGLVGVPTLESMAEDARMLLSLKGRGAATVGGAALRASMGGLIAALGAARVARHDVDDIVALEPLYLRPPDASIRAPEVSLSTSAKPGEDSYGTSRGRANPAACRP